MLLRALANEARPEYGLTAWLIAANFPMPVPDNVASASLNRVRSARTTKRIRIAITQSASTTISGSYVRMARDDPHQKYHQCVFGCA